MVSCISAFLDFCYLAQRSSHDSASLNAMELALSHFHQLQHIFQEHGVCPNGFSLPHQHSLIHYIHSIKLFGSPNGLCSSITESEHICAVKWPWWCSSQHNPLPQMLRINTCLQKIAAAQADFGCHGMLDGGVLSVALRTASEDVLTISFSNIYRDNPHEILTPDELDVQAFNSNTNVAIVEIAARAGTFVS